jgi:hypothetical protein
VGGADRVNPGELQRRVSSARAARGKVAGPRRPDAIPEMKEDGIRRAIPIWEQAGGRTRGTFRRSGKYKTFKNEKERERVKSGD